MTHRFLVYPLLLLAWLQLGPLLRRDARWNAATIAQLFVVLLLGGIALAVREGAWWVGLGWGVFTLGHIIPRRLLAASARDRERTRWRRAAIAEQLAGWLLLGRLGRLHRDFAVALRILAGGDAAAAFQKLRTLETASLPAAVLGMVRLWQLALRLQRREWMTAVALFQTTPDWGTAGLATQVRLQIARAYAELDDLPRALRCLQFVVLSPLVVRLETPLWTMRVRLAAMAGDEPELERLLTHRRQRRGFSRFAAYWRGRCALARADKPTAVRLLARAYAITDPRDRVWKQAIGHYLEQASAAATRVPVVPPEYHTELAALHHADEQSRPWRALMGWRPTPPVVMILLAEIAVVFAAQQLLPAPWDDRLVLWGSNGAFTIHFHQWWRLITAMFLHGGWLHFLMNGLSLWMFGTAVERAWGWWRMALVFLVAGAAGNLVSALLNQHDIAIGASGGVFALLGAYAVALWQLNTPLYAPLRSRMLRILFALVAVDLSIGWIEPQIDNLAHLGGFVAGLALAALLCPRHSGR